MELSVKKRKETGAFYTPKKWADLAVKKIQEIIPNLEDFVFYDPCCGEGALLEALPKGVEKYGTTLEWDDVEICRNKGLQVWQLDFLEDDISDILPESKMKRLIVFTNPPYVKLPSEKYKTIKYKYKNHDATALFYYRILNEIAPIMLFGFNKTDLWSSPQQKKFRNDFCIYERSLITPFLTPSKSWKLSGDFPICFNGFLMT